MIDNNEECEIPGDECEIFDGMLGGDAAAAPFKKKLAIEFEQWASACRLRTDLSVGSSPNRGRYKWREARLLYAAFAAGADSMAISMASVVAKRLRQVK